MNPALSAMMPAPSTLAIRATLVGPRDRRVLVLLLAVAALSAADLVMTLGDNTV